MARIIRVHDPSERQRRLPLVVQEEACPGLLEFLSNLQYGHETPLIRGIVYQWYLHHRGTGKLRDATVAVLAGPGGVQVKTRGNRQLHPEEVLQRDSLKVSKTAEGGAEGSGMAALTSIIQAAIEMPPAVSADSVSEPSAEQIALLSSLDAIFQQ